MKTNDDHLLKLLSNNNVTFFIPPYQRNYKWDDDQCDVFFDDIVKTARANAAGNAVEHFIGILVYVQEDATFGQPAKLVLVDGQQRVTTTMLFLTALRDVMDDAGMKSYIDSHYLRNNNVSGAEEYKVKLKQVETDWPAYLSLVMGLSLTEEQKNTRVAINYRRFCRRLEEVRDGGGLDLGDLASKGLEKFSVVTLQLEPEKNPWENPQEIFESMNSLGKPLSLADLVRNWLLMGQPANVQDKLYHDWWLPMEHLLDEGAIDQMSNFVRDYMQLVEHAPLKKASAHNHKELYAEFKRCFKVRNAADLLPEMTHYSQLYAPIVSDASSGNPTVDRILRDVRAIGSTTAYSLELALMESCNAGRMSQQALIAALDALRTYLLRRRIIDAAKGENKALPELVSNVERVEQSDNPGEAMFNILAGQGYTLRLPTDAEVMSRLLSMNFYSFSQAKFLLALVEESLTKARPDLKDKHLQLEHIMPQTLNDAWRAELGDEAERVHDALTDNLGNITLIRHNQELGNKAFAEKKQVYETHAGMQVSRTKITDCDTWDEQAIYTRGAWLADYVAKQVLPIPQALDTVAATATVRSKKTSLRELGLIGKVVEFVDDPSYKATVVSDKEVQFEGKRWRLSPLTRELRKRLGTVNPSGSYQGPKFWTYQGVRISDMVPVVDLGDTDEDEED